MNEMKSVCLGIDSNKKTRSGKSHTRSAGVGQKDHTFPDFVWHLHDGAVLVGAFVRRNITSVEIVESQFLLPVRRCSPSLPSLARLGSVTLGRRGIAEQIGIAFSGEHHEGPDY